MQVELTDRVILITGAASGIGAAIAAQATAAGALVVGLDRVAGPWITADLADPTATEGVVPWVIARHGRIDGLVNAAGITTRGSFTDGKMTDWDALFAINARAPFLLMQGAIRDMLGRRAPGSIVNIQSMNAHCGIPELAMYSASKGALQTLTKNAAHAHLADRIRVNGINLGWVDTPAERQMQAVTLGKGPDWMDQMAATLPLGRFVSADDCARLAVYLLSDASAPMTGVSMDLEQRITGGPG
jgi:NAD(P)-dependent dehydrogenase (short-subunit alcohol dehydrogenase family)